MENAEKKIKEELCSNESHELAKQMVDHGITDPCDLTEFDQWVNEATRVDIENIVKKYDGAVFGFHLWQQKPIWNKTRGNQLIGAGNFAIDMIFKNEDEQKVDKIIAEYEAAEKQEGTWNAKLKDASWKLVNGLSKIAVLHCSWV